MRPGLAVLLLAGALAADAAWAWAAELCTGVEAAPAASAEVLDLRVRAEPAAVLAAACAGAPSPQLQALRHGAAGQAVQALEVLT